MAAWPTVCRVLYDREPPPRYHDDDPLTPYRFSFLKSYTSNDSFERSRGRHYRRHRNTYRQHGDPSDRHGNPDEQWRTFLNVYEGRNGEEKWLSTETDTERDTQRVKEVVSALLLESDDIERGPDPVSLSQEAEGTDEDDVQEQKREESVRGSIHPPRRQQRLLWDPITNTWISPDPRNIDYLHFVNGLSLIDRGIYTKRRERERRFKQFPCTDKHTRHVDTTRRTTEQDISGIWAIKHRAGKRRLIRRVHDSLPEGLENIHPGEELAPHTAHSSSTSNVLHPFTGESSEKGVPDEESDSARWRSSDDIKSQASKTERSTGAGDGQDDLGRQGHLEEDGRSFLGIEADEDRTLVEPEDFISLDRRSSASEDGSDVGGVSGSRGSHRRRVRIGQVIEETNRPSSSESEGNEEALRRIIELKERRARSYFDASDTKGQLFPPVKDRVCGRGRKWKTGSEDGSEKDEAKGRSKQTKASPTDSPLQPHPPDVRRISRHSNRVSVTIFPPLVVDPDPQSELPNDRRRLSRRRLSWLQRLRKKAARATGGMRHEAVDSTDDDDVINAVDLRFEDYDWLAKYCILDPKTVAICKQIFDEVDEKHTGRLSCVKTMVALRASNYKLSDMLEEYMYKIMELTGYEIENGADYKLFAVLSALSLKITALDDWMKCLIKQTDLKTLEAKLFICKTLWECSVDPDTKTLSLEDLCVELRAGGVSYEHEQNARQKLEHLQHLDLLDFLTYLPLFIMIHESVVENPLEVVRNK